MLKGPLRERREGERDREREREREREKRSEGSIGRGRGNDDRGLAGLHSPRYQIARIKLSYRLNTH